MRHANIEQYWPLLEALKAGRTIQMKVNESWTDLVDSTFSYPPERFRVKPEPDPFEDLKKAHAEGKVIQALQAGSGTWHDIRDPEWGMKPENYRVKPEPAFTEWFRIINENDQAKVIFDDFDCSPFSLDEIRKLASEGGKNVNSVLRFRRYADGKLRVKHFYLEDFEELV